MPTETNPTRPLTPEAPEGWHYEAVEEDRRWRVIPPERRPRKCRWTINRKACGAPAEAELDRSWRGGVRENWWAYCGIHLYGRWIENGRIMAWRVVENGGDSSVTDQGAEARKGGGSDGV